MNVDAIGAREIFYLIALVSVTTLLIAFLLTRFWPLGISRNSRTFVLFAGAIILVSAVTSQAATFDSRFIGIASAALISLALILPRKSALHKHDAFVGDISIMSGVVVKEVLKYQLTMSFVSFGIIYVLLHIVFRVGINI